MIEFRITYDPDNPVLVVSKTYAKPSVIYEDDVNWTLFANRIYTADEDDVNWTLFDNGIYTADVLARNLKEAVDKFFERVNL